MIESIRMEMPEQLRHKGGIYPGLLDYKSNALSPELTRPLLTMEASSLPGITYYGGALNASVFFKDRQLWLEAHPGHFL